MKIDELSAPNIGGLKDKIRETIKECSSRADNKLLLFHNKVRLPENSSISLDDDKVKITEDSTIFVVMVPEQATKQEENKVEQPNKAPAGQPAQAQMPPHGDFSSMYFPHPRSPNMDGRMQDPAMSMTMKALEQMMDNPESIMQAMEIHMPNMTEEQKNQLRQQIEFMRSNPELVGQILNNPAMSGMMGNNPYMAGMGGTPPMMGGPGFYSPHMNYQQPWPMPPNGFGADRAQPNGPCSHGYYPPQYAGETGTPQQDATKVWAVQLSCLKEMGFDDEETNVKALRKSKGDISKAIEYLTDAREKN